MVTTTDLPAEVIEQIEAEYPVIALRGSDASDPIGKMRSDARDPGRGDRHLATRREEALADFDAKVAEGKAALDEAGKAGAAVHVRRRLGGGRHRLHPHVHAGLATSAASRAQLGLENAWTGEGDADYGLGATDVEGLTSLGDVEFLYVGNDTDGGDAFKDGLAGNAIWEQLPFVVAGNTTPPARRHLDVRRPAVGDGVHRRRRGRDHRLTPTTSWSPHA